MNVYSLLFSIINLLWVIEIRVWQKEKTQKVNVRLRALKEKTQIMKIIISIKSSSYSIPKLRT